MLKFLSILMGVVFSTVANAQEGAEVDFLQAVDNLVGEYIVAPMASVLFYSHPTFMPIPLILVVMVSGGIFFTFR